MTVTIQPGAAQGTLAAIPSKSAAHRLLICAALADRPTRVVCPQSSQDIDATLRCLQGLGAQITQREDGYEVIPLDRDKPVQEGVLDCGESGSTLRFLLPVAGALGAQVTFQTAGRLVQRPMGPLVEQLEENGCAVTLDQEHKTIAIAGRLMPGVYQLPGNISSQFISGLLFALPLLGQDSQIRLTSPLRSAGYVDMTRDVLRRFGVRSMRTEDGFSVPGGQTYRLPAHELAPEGDWSGAAVWLAVNALGGRIALRGLKDDSLQSDRRMAQLACTLPGTVDIADIPDLLPLLCVLAAFKPAGTRFTHAGRLRYKESDRLNGCARLICDLGGLAQAEEDALLVQPRPLTGGETDARGDHRMAMAAAAAACVCPQGVLLRGAECVDKSYPAFWADYKRLGGQMHVL